MFCLGSRWQTPGRAIAFIHFMNLKFGRCFFVTNFAPLSFFFSVVALAKAKNFYFVCSVEASSSGLTCGSGCVCVCPLPHLYIFLLI